MDDDIETMLVEVRAGTSGFASDLAQIRSSFDSTLIDGFTQAGNVLERGLVSALRKGALGFDDLKRVATQTLDQIAAQALQLGLDQFLGSGKKQGSIGNLFGNLIGSVLGLPGRATGGPVSPGRGYLVGERGPELFVPTSAGRVEASPDTYARPRDVRIAITLSPNRGESAPATLQRSSRQLASAVRRALISE